MAIVHTATEQVFTTVDGDQVPLTEEILADQILENLGGPDALKGEDGLGVPAGGEAGQVLAKASGDDNDTEWVDPAEGGGGSVPDGGTTGQVLAKLSNDDGDADWATISADGAAGTPSLRTLGTGGTQALPGNHASTTNQRTPTDGSVTNAKVAGGAAIARSKLDFGSGLVNADISAVAAIAWSKIVSTGALGVVYYGSDADTARLTGFAIQVWVGDEGVEPTHMIDNDILIQLPA